MAYTRNWSNSIPAGSRAAKEIDDAIRELRLDLYERLGTILRPPDSDEPMDDEPLELLPEYSGKLEDNVRPVSHLILRKTSGDEEISRDEYAFSTGAVGWLDVSPGQVIKLFGAYVSRGGGTSISMVLQTVNMITGTRTNLHTAKVRSASGYGLLVTDALAYTVLDNETVQVYFEFDGPSLPNALVRGMQLTRDRSDNRYS